MYNCEWGWIMDQVMVGPKPRAQLSHSTGAWSLTGKSCHFWQLLCSFQVTIFDVKQHWSKALPHSQLPRSLGKYFSKHPLILKHGDVQMLEVLWPTSPDA